MSLNPHVHGASLSLKRKMTVNDDTRAAASTSRASTSNRYNELIREFGATVTNQINKSR